jgi:hypothetical protein
MLNKVRVLTFVIFRRSKDRERLALPGSKTARLAGDPADRLGNREISVRLAKGGAEEPQLLIFKLNMYV